MMIIFVLMGFTLFLMGCVLFGFEVVRFVDERKEKREEEKEKELKRFKDLHYEASLFFGDDNEKKFAREYFETEKLKGGK